MSLMLGNSFNRSYNVRLSFLDGYYNINIFFNKKSTFLLFGVESANFKNDSNLNYGAKINMFKNLQSSKFCETFLNLHNYKNSKLDIVNQFESIKPEYASRINFLFNESINLSRINIEGKTLYDTLLICGLTLESYSSEFIFIIAERQNIIQRLNKKIIRTTAIQIATANSIGLMNEFYDENKKSRNYIPDLEVD